MDAFMNITINVRSTSAERQIRNVAREVEYVRRVMERARIAGARFGALSSSNLERYAKNLQWVGRQIEFNFTLPLLLAGGAITKWELDNQRAMTRVRKVYNESATTAGDFNKEITDLATSFRLLSDAFGVHQNEVIEIGAAWAQAGANGRALAEATKQTLEVMILGEMEAAEATEALIAIQSQYALNTEELALVMGQLNAIENETAVSFQGLVQAMSRGAGAARAAGVDWREFAAMTAALVPAAGGAAEAGNALRTMISRIMAPTGEARDLMQELGLQVNDVAWNSSNFVQRLQLLREAMDGVTTSQRNQVAATVASRWQVNRFNILLNDLTDSNSRYAKALSVTADEQEVMNRYQDELRTYLTSTPQGFSILTTQIRNLLTQGIQPLLPFFLQVLTVVRDVVRWFVELPGPVKRTIAVLTGLLIVLGPLLRIWGAFGLVFTRTWALLKILSVGFGKLIGIFGALAGVIGKALGGILAVVKGVGVAIQFVLGGLTKSLLAVVNPWVLAIGAIIAAVVLFRDQIRDALQWVANNWRQLPSIVGNALVAVVRTIRDAALAAYEWLSYFNPFVRHSPSLVESVKAGMAVISSEYASLGNLGSVFQRSIDVLENFKRATASAGDAIRAAELSEDLNNILKFSPNAEGPFRATVASIKELEALLPPLQNEYNAQAVVVNRWSSELDRANEALEDQRDHLETLRDRASTLQNALAGAKDRLSELASTPIKGMQAMSNAIFKNEMAQKRLRLEILKIEEAGDAIEDVRDRMAALSGDIELLRGRREDLRLAGAGSDVLGVLDSEISALEAQRRALMQAGSDTQGATQLDRLRAKLAELEKQGEILDLEESLKFDPLARQIDRVVNGMNEMPFDKLIGKIREEQKNVSDLTKRWKEAEAAVQAQEDVIDIFETRRDEIQETYDLELARLNEIETAYSAVESQIRDMEAALKDMASAADRAIKAAKKAKEDSGGSAARAVEDFRNSVGDFEIPGGSGADLTGGSIEDFNAEMQAMVEGLFPSIDIRGMARRWWGQAVDWMEQRWEDFRNWFSSKTVGISGFVGSMREAWGGFVGWLTTGSVGSFFETLGDKASAAWDVITKVGEYLSGPFFGIIDMVGDFINDVFGNVWEELQNWWNELAPAAKDAWNSVVDIIGDIVHQIGIVVGAIVWVIYAAWAPLSRILKPILDGIAELVRNVMQAIRGVIQIVLGLINGNFSDVWNGILTFLDAVWDAIFNVFKTALGIIWGIVQSVFGLIRNWISSVWKGIGVIVRRAIDYVVNVFRRFDKATGGIFSGIFNFLKKIFNWIKDRVFAPVWGFVKRLVIDSFTRTRDSVIRAWTTLRNGVQGAWNWMVRNVFNPIRNFVGDRVIKPFFIARDNVVSAWQNIYNRTREIVGAVRGWLGEKINGIKDFVVGKFNTIKDRVIGVWEAIGSTISDIADGIWGSMKRAINFMIDGVNAMIRMWNGIEFGLPRLPDWVPGVGGKGGGVIGTPDINYIPRLETGGVFDRPTLAMIAETTRARPEIVTPERLMRQVFRSELSSLKRDGKGDMNFYGDLSFPNITSGDDAEEFVRNLESLGGGRR